MLDQRVCKASRTSVAMAVFVVLLLGGRAARAERSTLPPETGFNYGEQEDARWGGFAGALRAMGKGATGVFGNPAGLAASRVYHVGALAQIWPEARRQSYGAVAMDSITTRLAAGLGYVWTDQDPDGIKRRTSDLRLALAFPFSDRVSFGLTGRYLRLEQRGLGPLGPSQASGGKLDKPMLSGFSFDAGLRAAPTENIAIGLLGTNLSNPGNGLQPTTFGGGLGVGTADFGVEADLVGDFTTWNKTTTRVMGGAELLLADHFPLRVGYRYDAGALSHAVSGGAGYIDNQFSLDFALRRIVNEPQATTVLFSLQYFVDSSGITRSATPY